MQVHITDHSLVFERYFGSASSTPVPSKSQSLSTQPEISPVNSQCDEGGDSKHPGSVSSQSGAGYRAKFLGALDDLEKSASPQVRRPTLIGKYFLLSKSSPLLFLNRLLATYQIYKKNHKMSNKYITTIFNINSHTPSQQIWRSKIDHCGQFTKIPHIFPVSGY